MSVITFWSASFVDIFVARQPILDASKSVCTCELLFGSGPENYSPDCDRDAAAPRVITDGASVFGMDSLIGGKRAFVNVTRRVLTDGLFSFLPREWVVVVELLDTVEADGEAACKALAAVFGYNGGVNSVREAIILIGERQVKKWAMMMARSEIGEDSPQALLSTCLTRARFCELMASSVGTDTQRDNSALIGRPLPELLGELAVSHNIRTGLLEGPATAQPRANHRHRPRARRLGHGGAADHVAGGYRADGAGVPHRGPAPGGRNL